jgi:hypothetical protein
MALASFGRGFLAQPVARFSTFTLAWALNIEAYRAICLWPLKERDFDRVGVTVHDCLMHLDAGGVLAAEVVGIEHGDRIHDVFATQVIKGAQIYADCAARELEVGVPRTPQELHLGREFKGWELGLTAELRARRNLSRRWANMPIKKA